MRQPALVFVRRVDIEPSGLVERVGPAGDRLGPVGKKVCIGEI